jgi:hypothetical protein
LLVIGCGQYGCPIAVVAETMISEALNQLQKLNHRIEVIFILEEHRHDLYAAFTNCLGQHSDKIHFIPERNKRQTQTCMYTHHSSNIQEQHNISAASNAFYHAYIAFQHTLSYSESVTNNQTSERREKERKMGERM